MGRYFPLWASPSPLWWARFFPGQALAHVFCCLLSPPCPSPLGHVLAAFSSCSPHRPHLDSVQPTRSAHFYSPPLPRSDSTRDHRATLGSTRSASPFSSPPSSHVPPLPRSS